MEKLFYPEREAFGPIEAADLVDTDGNLSSSYAISNTIKDTIEMRGNRRSLVIGRKGSGKTTLLFMSKSKSKINCVLDIGGEFPTVVEALSKEVRTQFTEPAARIWSTVIWNTIILSTYDQLADRLSEISNEDRSILTSYVSSLESCLDEKSSTRAARVAQALSDRVNRGSMGMAAAMIRAALQSDMKVDQGIQATEKLLLACGKKATILIDTMEFYGVRQSQPAKDCIRGLLNCCARVHRESPEIECRLFFPDELTQFVKTEISNSVLKDFRDVQHLRWESSQLVCLAALRLRDKIGLASVPDWELEDLTYSDVDKAQRVLHRFLPTLVSNDRDVSFEVLSYILRHTQRTPRQFLWVLNLLASEVISTDGKKHRVSSEKLDAAQIQAAIKRSSQEIYTDILATYREIYPDLGKVISRVLPRLPRAFDDDQLFDVCSRYKVYEDFGFDFEDFKFALSDVGAVGTVDETKSNENSVHGSFSYMTDQRLLLSAPNRFCVHPIFSSMHAPLPSDGVTVYPKGSGVNDF